MTITNNTELRDVYLHVFDAFATDPHTVVEEVDGVTNVRFARELLGTLVTAGLVAITEGVEGNDVWQTCPDTYDSMTREEAESKIDNWLNDTDEDNTMITKPETKTRPAKAKDQTFHACYCGCGANVPSTSFYRPGHDARHAGVVGRKAAEEILSTGGVQVDLKIDSDRFADLPSASLVQKAVGIANRAMDKETSKVQRAAERAAAKEAKFENLGGTITVSKKERKARKNADGTVEYLDHKDEWKVASKTAASTFQPAE
jgi:hypothetical protein